MDLSAVFDTIEHGILQHRLEFIGVKGRPIANIVRNHGLNVHLCADDTQLYFLN